jgi:hypothetical protein
MLAVFCEVYKELLDFRMIFEKDEFLVIDFKTIPFS